MLGRLIGLELSVLRWIVFIRTWHSWRIVHVIVKFIHGWFSSIHIVFDIHFPIRIGLLQSMDDVSCKSFVSLHGDEGITEEIISSSGIISFDDSRCEWWYLTYLRGAICSSMAMS